MSGNLHVNSITELRRASLVEADLLIARASAMRS